MSLTSLYLSGNWDDECSEENFSGFSSNDKKAILNPKWQRKLHTVFKRSKHRFDLVFMNKPNHDLLNQYTFYRKNTDGCLIAVKHLNRLLPVKKHDEDSITVIFTNNMGDDHIPITPWIVAHRIAHTLKNNAYYHNVDRRLDSFLRHNFGEQSLFATDFLLNHLPFRSASTGQLKRYGEVFNEFGAYFVLNNTIGMQEFGGVELDYFYNELLTRSIGKIYLF